MSFLERNRGILDRAHRLDGLEGALRRVLIEGKREQLLAGVDATGRPFAPAAPATIARRGPGTVLVPRGDASALIARYTVTIDAAPGRLTISAAWPGLPWVKYHETGTRRMPRRDPSGFRGQDTAECLERLRKWVMGDA